MDELVRLAPAATTFRRTPSLVADPTSQGLSLRAVGPSGVSRALVLVDGVPANDPFGGWIYWRALPRLGLDHIEVVPGGSSALYGNYALGGVVQLAGRGYEPAVDIDLAAGSLRTASLAGRAAGRRGPVAAALELDGLRSDGYIPVAPAQRGPIDIAGESRHMGASGRGEFQPGEPLAGGGALRRVPRGTERRHGADHRRCPRPHLRDHGPARGRGLGRPGAGRVGEPRQLRPDPPAHRRR